MQQCGGVAHDPHMAFPENQIAAFKAAATGTYRLVLRGTGADAAGGAKYTLSTTLRPARAGIISGSGTDAEVPVAFDAAAGRILSGTLRGTVVGGATLTGPGGTVQPVTLLRRRAPRIDLTTSTLADGSGSYTLRFTATGTVSWTLRLAPPRRVKRVDEL